MNEALVKEPHVFINEFFSFAVLWPVKVTTVYVITTYD